LHITHIKIFAARHRAGASPRGARRNLGAQIGMAASRLPPPLIFCLSRAFRRAVLHAGSSRTFLPYRQRKWIGENNGEEKERNGSQIGMLARQRIGWAKKVMLRRLSG